MRAHDALTFPILSVIAHLGMLAIASVALDMPLLANPLLVAVFCMAWTLASAAPSAAERLGGVGRALALAVGCPLALLVVGVLYAGAIERGTRRRLRRRCSRCGGIFSSRCPFGH